MKKLLVASIAAAAFCAAPALAADMPVKAPSAPMFNWTGFYAGIEGGGGWGHERWTDNGGIGTANFKPDGGILGGQIGYRWQAKQFVFGVEATGAWGDLSNTVSNQALAIPVFETFKVRGLYSATAQLGLASDRWLAYVKGGWASASTHIFFNAPTFPPAGLTGSSSPEANGWTLGAGIDYAVWQNVIVGVEYDHFDLNYKPFAAAVSNGGVPLIVTNTSRLTIDQVVARLSYKFN